MSIRIRADEKAALVEALEGDYVSPEAAAGAIFSLCADLLAKRDTHALVVQWGPGVLYGPYFGLTDAKKAGRLAASTFASDAPEGVVRVIPLGAPVVLLGSLTALPGGTVGCECGHAWGGHIDKQWKQWKRGVKDWGSQPWRKPGCMSCACKNTSEKDVAA